MAENWIVPGRFADIDVLYMFEALAELTAHVSSYDDGDVQLDELLLMNASVREKLHEIEKKVSIPRVYLSA